MKAIGTHIAITIFLIMAAAQLALGQKYIAALADRESKLDLGRKVILLLEYQGGRYIVRDSLPLLEDEFGLQFYIVDSTFYTLYKSHLSTSDSLRLMRYRIESGKLALESWINIQLDDITCCPLCLFLRGPGKVWLDCDRRAVVVDLETMKIERHRKDR